MAEEIRVSSVLIKFTVSSLRIAFQLQTTHKKYVFQQFFGHFFVYVEGNGCVLTISGFDWLLVIASMDLDNNSIFLSAIVFFLEHWGRKPCFFYFLMLFILTF